MSSPPSRDDYRLGVIGATASILATLFGMAVIAFGASELASEQRILVLVAAALWLAISIAVLVNSLHGLRR
jgi:ABC-type transport system involved in multi-copper enzyme maturation permease subunit